MRSEHFTIAAMACVFTASLLDSLILIALAAVAVALVATASLAYKRR